MLKLYHDGGRKIDVARRDVIGMLMPTAGEGLLAHLRKKYNPRAFNEPNIEALQVHLTPLLAMYLYLFNHTQRCDIT
jgi:hypothetical protein